MLPAASRTRSTSTYVPGGSASVVNRNDSRLSSNRPSAGNTLIHLRPLIEYDAPARRDSASAVSASIAALPPSTDATRIVTAGGSWATTTGPLTRWAVSAAPSGLSGRSLATTFTRYTPAGVVVVSQSHSGFVSPSSSSTQS